LPLIHLKTKGFKCVCREFCFFHAPAEREKKKREKVKYKAGEQEHFSASLHLFMLAKKKNFFSVNE